MINQPNTHNGPARRLVLTRLGVVLLLPALLGSGCSVRRAAVNMVGDALAGGGAVFASDDDPELIKAAVPFGLKLSESLLSESPEHRGLLTSVASGFTQYAYAFVQQESDQMRATDLARSRELQVRARKLYLRARDYGLRGLETSHRGFREQLAADAQKAVSGMKRGDVPLLYRTAAAWVAAISMDKTDSYLISDLPKVDALLLRALELDETFDRGALPSLMITYETVRQGAEGDPYERARRRYERAVELSQGLLAGPHVSLAEAVCIPTENREEFLRLLDLALAIDADALPEARLANLIVQDRARWLKASVDNYFLPPLDDDPQP
jgi:predicted anti-sigma-YlaC factor YlaD